MLSYIESLQRKPEGARKRVAFFLAVILTGLIFIAWLLTRGLTPPGEEVSGFEAPKTTETPASSLFEDGTKNLFGGGAMEQTKDVFKNDVGKDGSYF